MLEIASEWVVCVGSSPCIGKSQSLDRSLAVQGFRDLAHVCSTTVDVIFFDGELCSVDYMIVTLHTLVLVVSAPCVVESSSFVAQWAIKYRSLTPRALPVACKYRALAPRGIVPGRAQ